MTIDVEALTQWKNKNKKYTKIYRNWIKQYRGVCDTSLTIENVLHIRFTVHGSASGFWYNTVVHIFYGVYYMHRPYTIV